MICLPFWFRMGILRLERYPLTTVQGLSGSSVSNHPEDKGGELP